MTPPHSEESKGQLGRAAAVEVVKVVAAGCAKLELGLGLHRKR